MDNVIEMERAPQGTAEAFADRIGRYLDAGAVAIMLSYGHRLALFETLAGMAPATSGEIADRAGCAERYVREWLAVMVVGGVVTYEPRTGRYTLPREHAQCLTRNAPLGNLAVYAQTVAMLGQMQERLLDCFRTGDGLAYDAYPRFHDIMEEDSGQTVTAGLFEHVLPLVPDLAERLEQGIDVLDSGCGRGSALIALARRYPDSRFVGYDLGADAIAHANAAAEQAGLRNLRFEARDMSRFADRQRFDLITSFDAVHDQKDPAALLTALRGALRPGGVLLMQDIGGSARLENNLDFPMAALLYAISCVHCTPVSLGQGGAGLGTMWGWETAERMLRGAGFARVDRHTLAHDPMNVWFVARRDQA